MYSKKPVIKLKSFADLAKIFDNPHQRGLEKMFEEDKNEKLKFDVELEEKAIKDDSSNSVR